MKVLVIDDAPDVADVVSICIEMRWPSAIVLSAPTGPKGLELVARESPDLVILDVGLPILDGYQVLKQIRAKSQVPVIMLTARDSDTDIARALEMGADDYVSKPFSHIELLARMNAVLRRAHAAAGDNPPPFESSGVRVDFAGREVWVKGQKVRLTPIEFAILSHLARNAGKVVTHKELLTSVWGEEYTDAVNYLKVHMQRLRRKLAVDPQDPSPILTEWKVGYKLSLSPDDSGRGQPAMDPSTP
ncbi:MAG: response regulator transcription factor [Chloroflexota bacterium]|nr:response regulator transcription factor [Chloroflexota bacterium]